MREEFTRIAALDAVLEAPTLIQIRAGVIRHEGVGPTGS